MLKAELVYNEWHGGDTIPEYNLSPGRSPLLLHMLNGRLQSDYLIWGYNTPNEAAARRKPWINARQEGSNGPLFSAHVQGRQGSCAGRRVV